MPYAYTFVFPDEDHALLFARRLTLTLVHVAFCRTGAEIMVLDGADESQERAIRSLAEASGATRAVTG